MTDAVGGRDDRAHTTPAEKRKSRTRRTLDFLVEEFDLALMVLGGVAIGAGSLADATWVTGPGVATVVVAVGLRVFRTRYQLLDLENVYLQVSRGAQAEMSGQIDAIGAQIASLAATVVSDLYHEAERCTRDRFYEHMLTAVERAQVSVDLTQLDERPPKDIGTAGMVAYFERQAEIVRERPSVIFRRIVAVPTLEKLEWLLEVLTKVGESPNFQIAIVDTADASPSLPPPLSLQIFDEREMCLVDPTIGYMRPERQTNMLWVHGRATAAVFSVYYDDFWKLSTRLKEGSIIYWSVLDHLLDSLRSRRPDQAELADRLRRQLGVLSGRDSQP